MPEAIMLQTTTATTTTTTTTTTTSILKTAEITLLQTTLELVQC